MIGSVVNVSHADSHGGGVVAYFGQTRVNSYKDPTSTSASLDIKLSVSKKIGISFIFLNEGNPLGFVKRDGIAPVLQWRIPFTSAHSRWSVSLGAGPYAYCATAHSLSTNGGYVDKHGIGVVVVASVAYRIKHYTVNAHWIRVMIPNDTVINTLNNTDTDVPGVGIGKVW